MAYCAASDLLLYGDFEGDTDSPLLTLLCTYAEKIIERKTGRSFEATTDIRYFDAKKDIDSDTLWLDKDLLVDSNNVVGIGVEGWATDIFWDSDETYFVTEPRNEQPVYALTLTSEGGKDWTYDSNPENAISIDGTWGYSSNVPSDIKWASIRLALWLYKQRETDVDLDRPLLTGDGMTIMPTRLPADVSSILELYRSLDVSAI